jgi:hypothetical protein
MHVSALSGEYYILADLLRWLNVRLCANSAQVPFIRHWLRGGAVFEGIRFAFYSQASDTSCDTSCSSHARRSETITNVFRNRRFACALLGAWLGACVCVDLLVNQNLSAVDRFLADPGSARAAAQIDGAGSVSVRFMLRRNATEENAWVLTEWEWAQIGLSVAVFFLAILGDQPASSAFRLIPVMLLIVVLQLALVTPHITSLAREVDEIPVGELLSNIQAGRLEAFSWTFWGGEALKTLLGMGLLWNLMVRRERTRSGDREAESGTVNIAEAGAKSEVRVRRRRRSSNG